MAISFITQAQRESLIELYVGYFNRAPEAAGLNYWSTELLKGLNAGQTEAATLTSIANQFYDAGVQYNIFSAAQPVEAFIATAYKNALGRDTVDTDGMAYWTEKLTSGEVSRGEFVQQLIQDAKAFAGDATWGWVAVYMENRVAVANTFADNSVTLSGQAAIDAGSSALSVVTPATAQAGQTAAEAVAAAEAGGVAGSTGQTFTLTAGVDSLVGTGGNDTFTATPDANSNGTWTALDSVNGGAGNDTFTVAQTAAITAVPAGFSITNVETATLVSGGSITANAATWSVDTLNITAGGTSNVTAKATTNVNELNSTSSSAITGGNNVTVVQSTDAGVEVTGAAGTVNVTSDGAVSVIDGTTPSGAVTIAAKGNIVSGGTTLNASILDAVTLADRVANEDARDAAYLAAYGNNVTDGASQVADDASDLVNGLTAMNAAVAAATNVVSNRIALTAVQSATLSALNDGYITVAQKTAIDAAYATGLASSTVAATALTAAKAAALALETPLLTAAAAALVVADDAYATAQVAYNEAQAAVNDDYNLDGINADITNINGITASKGLTSATVSGNYYNDGGDVTLTDGSTLGKTLTAVTLDNTGNAVLTGKALTSVTLSNLDGVDVTISNTTATHTQNLNLSDADVGVSDAAATALVIASNGTANALEVNAALVTAVTVTGAAALELYGTIAATAVITATDATGNIETAVDVGQSYLGGAGADTVAVTGATKQTAAVSGGAGSADVLVIADDRALEDTGAAKFTGFEVLQVSGDQSVDITKLTGNTFTSVVLDYNAAVTGLNAVQAANITITDWNEGSMSIGVKDAAVNGNLDTVTIDVNDGDDTSVDTISLGNLSLLGVETVNLTATDSINMYLNGAASLTNLNVSGGGNLSVDSNGLAINVNTVIDAHAVTGEVYIDASGNNTNGIKIIGSDTADSEIYGVSDKANVLSAGNGNNYIVGGSAADTITSGNGNSYIDAGAGANVVTVGNGFNYIVSGAGADTITVGTGGNFIAAGTGADAITLGAHALGTTNEIVVLNGDSGVTVATADTITGFVTGVDVLATNVAGVATASTGNYVEATAAVADFAAATIAANAALATLNGTSAGNTLYSLQWVGTTAYLFSDYTDGDVGASDGTADQVITLVGVTGATFAATDIVLAAV